MLAPAEAADRNLESSNAGASSTDLGDDVKESCDGDVSAWVSLETGARRVVSPACLGNWFALAFTFDAE
jgi:hypothetical protein